MAAPTASFIRVPPDGNYTGPRLKVVERQIGSDVTYTHVGAFIDDRKVNGAYAASTSGALPVLISGHTGSSTAFLWLSNPTSSNVVGRLRRIIVDVQNIASAATHASSPIIRVSRATFTGAFTGPSLTPAKKKTTDSAATMTAALEASGATIDTASGAAWGSLIPGMDITSAAGQAEPWTINHREVWRPPEEEWINLSAGECLVFWQSDNGTATDTRTVNFSVVWDEVDST